MKPPNFSRFLNVLTCLILASLILSSCDASKMAMRQTARKHKKALKLVVKAKVLAPELFDSVEVNQMISVPGFVRSDQQPANLGMDTTKRVQLTFEVYEIIQDSAKSEAVVEHIFNNSSDLCQIDTVTFTDSLYNLQIWSENGKIGHKLSLFERPYSINYKQLKIDETKAINHVSWWQKLWKRFYNLLAFIGAGSIILLILAFVLGVVKFGIGGR